MESLQLNVERLKLHKAKLLVFPRAGTGKKGVKKGDTPRSELTNVAQNTLKEIIPIPKAFGKAVPRAITDADKEKSAVKILRKAKTDEKYAGAKAKKAAAAKEEK